MAIRFFSYIFKVLNIVLLYEIQDILVSGLVGWLRDRKASYVDVVRSLEMAGCPPGVENGLLDVVRSSDMADYELKMAGWVF